MHTFPIFNLLLLNIMNLKRFFVVIVIITAAL